MLEGTVDVPIRKYWSVNAYAGTMWGGGVVTRMFTGQAPHFLVLENVIRCRDVLSGSDCREETCREFR